VSDLESGPRSSEEGGGSTILPRVYVALYVHLLPLDTLVASAGCLLSGRETYGTNRRGVRQCSVFSDSCNCRKPGSPFGALSRVDDTVL
jgi:hypothetical protein